MPKRVLIITYYWPPAGGIAVVRWVKFVKYLREYGWEPLVYTVSKGSYPLMDTSLEKDIPEGLTIIKRPIWEPYNFYKFFTHKKSNVGGREEIKSKGTTSVIQKISIWLRGNLFIPDARALWIKPSVDFLWNYLKSNPVDAVVSTGPPHSLHLIALGLRKKMNIPWLADFRDPWTTMDYYKDLMLTNWADRKHHRLEMEVLRNADEVSVVGYAMKMEFEKKRGGKVNVVTNGFDESDFITDKIVLDTHFSIVYVGSLYQRRNPIALWKAISELKKENHPCIRALRIKLTGSVDAEIIETIKAYDLIDLLELNSFMPRHEAIKSMKSAQVLLLPIDNFEGAQWVLTGKLFEYLAAHRPILCIGPTDGDAAHIISQVGAGKTISFEDYEMVKQYLIDSYRKFEHGSLYLDERKGLNYSYSQLTEQIKILLDNITR